jgi:AbrB family looped-hinge helix DNA binding protein
MVMRRGDRFGRILIPKRVRDGLGLRPGSDLDIEETEGAILLRPVATDPPLIDEGGVLVFAGVADEDLAVAVERLRSRRHESLLTGGRTGSDE